MENHDTAEEVWLIYYKKPSVQKKLKPVPGELKRSLGLQKRILNPE